MSNINKIEGMCLAGGSISMIRSLGMIRYLEERNLIGSIKVISGNSFGSIVALGMSLGMQYSDLLNWMLDLRTSDAIDISFDDIIENLVNYGGMDDGSIFMSTLIDLLQKQGVKYDISFKELFELKGKSLFISATRLRDYTSIYFNIETSPNMPVIDAVRCSMSIPIIFEPFRYQGELYCDGGLLDNYPYAATQRFMSKQTINSQNLFGIKLFKKPFPISSLSNPLEIYTQYTNFFFTSTELPYDIEKTLISSYKNDIGLVENITIDIRQNLIDNTYQECISKWGS